jgi:asparagine synthase (glutamine-hydrolysing)
MAHRRLSIIDLAGGRQPLFNEDRQLALIANAEIYNFVELRAQLEARGHRFATHSDCEVILHLYEERGERCVDELRGMFAFALWDTQRRRLLLARDRMGEKPLYLYQRGRALVFASEFKALLASGKVAAEIEARHVDLFFRYGYVPEPRTLLRGVRKLPAGCFLTVDLDPWSVRETRYWSLGDAPPVEGDPVAVLRGALEELAGQIVRADVPVGVALSGGLDSSLVAALARQAVPRDRPVHAFTAGYAEGAATDERSAARRLAQHLGLDFHEVIIDTGTVAAEFVQTVAGADDPVADYAAPALHYVARAARAAGVPVLIGGMGGDELFWGYAWVNHARARNRQRHGGLGAYLWQREPRYFLDRWSRLSWLMGGGQLGARLRAWKHDSRLGTNRPVFYHLLPDYHEVARAADFYTPQFGAQLESGHDPDEPFYAPSPGLSPEVQLVHAICQTYLQGNGLTLTDRLTMAASIEFRTLLVDHKFVELVVGLLKHNPDLPGDKALLREVAAKWLPAWVLERPKQGFTPPVFRWHREFFQRYGAQLVDGALVGAGIVRPQAAARAARSRQNRPGVYHPLTYKALILELWLRQVQGWAGSAAAVDQLIG